MSSHINELKALVKQLAEVGVKVEEDDQKGVLLNSLSSKYHNVVFTLSQLSAQSLDDMISALLAKDKRLSATNSENFVPSERALFSRSHKKVGNNIECYYCRKVGHTAWYCKTRANDILKGKIRDKEQHNRALTVEEHSESEDEIEKCYEDTKEQGLF